MRSLAALLLLAACSATTTTATPPPSAPTATPTPAPTAAPVWKHHPAPVADSHGTLTLVPGAKVSVDAERDRFEVSADGVTGAYPNTAGVLGALDEIGEVTSIEVIVSDDATYGRLIEILDAVRDRREALTVSTPGASDDPGALAGPSTSTPIAATPVLSIGDTDLRLDRTSLISLAALEDEPGDSITELDAALAARPPVSTVVIFAHGNASGVIFNRVMRTARHRGVSSFAFAIENAP
jgi:hypothetical protein